MTRVDLREYQPADVELTPAQLAALHGHRGDLGITIEPTDNETTWRLTPGSIVGALDIGDLSVAIQPKLDIGRVLFLASYALGEFKLRDLEVFHFPEQRPPVEAMASLFADAARRAFSRGLLRGYRTEEEALHTVRGRIRIADQARRRFAIPLPVEVRYDDFTEDILANRLVKAATHALGVMRLRHLDSHRHLTRVRTTLDNVALVEFPPNEVPEVTFDRLNDHYREAIALSRLILQHATVETGRGRVRASGFLMDMNKVFEGFVRCALREKLGLSKRAFPDRSGAFLDQANRIQLRPDLTWWRQGGCVFVGDAKYKPIHHAQVPNADLYQLLAYATALDLPGGILIYAKGERDPAIHQVRNAGKRLEVFALDLAGEPAAILEEISGLAERVRAIASSVPATHRAA